MKTQLIILLAFCQLSISSFGQSTATNFTQNDCNGNPQDLFADLDAGHAVVLYYYMPNCATCPPPAEAIQDMANNINAVCPDLVKGYAFSYLNNTPCSYTASWVSGNGLPLYAPMDNGAYQVAYYGGFGMPTVVLVGGGASHDVLFVTQNWLDSDTTTMRDLILNMSCVAGTEELLNVNSTLQIFPNPAVNEVNITFNISNDENVFFELQDITGRTIIEKYEVENNNGQIQHSMNLAGIPDGNYFIKAINNEKIMTEKVLIKH
jgi:hypothetical protein